MLPIDLANDLDAYYAAHFPGIAPIGAVASLESKGRRLSTVDAHILATRAADISPRAIEYLRFAEQMLRRFAEVEEYYRSHVTAADDHKDATARPGGWAGPGCLPLAMALYVAVKDGVAGDYVECGVFKGGSLACLSHACAHLGRVAVAADTFEGLPSGDESGYWRKGQFLGRLDEVQHHITQAGVPSVVRWRKGLFADTLPSLDSNVAVVFLDTDLYRSSLDALTALAPKMSPGTLVASDGISGEYDFQDGAFVPYSMEGKALVSFFDGAPYSASWTGNGHMALFKRSIAVPRLAYSRGFLNYLTYRCGLEQRLGAGNVLVRRADESGLRDGMTEADVLELLANERFNAEYARRHFMQRVYVDRLRPVLSAVRRANVRKVTIYGAGDVGGAAIAACRADGIGVVRVVDGNSALWGGTIDGVPVLPVEACREDIDPAVMLASFVHAAEMRRNLRTVLGGTKARIFAPARWVI